MPLQDIRGQATRRTPDELLAHLNTFQLEPRFSAGIWFFSPPFSRFHEKYQPDLTIEQRLEVVAGLKDHGLSGIEAHYPNEINEDNVDMWRKFSSDTGIRLISVIPLLFWDAQFEFGSLSSPLADVRSAAIERTKRALAMNVELDTDFAVVWPGIDGFENPFGLDLTGMRDRFVDGLAEAMDEVPGVRIAFEPKPYEPRGRILFGTTGEGVLMGRLVEEKLRNEKNRALLDDGHALCCMNPEIGHVLMGFEDLAYAFSLALAEGRLAHSHWNSQPLGNYDQDLNVGVIAVEQLDALMYALKMYGYDGYYGIDINPERMPVDVAMRISMDAVRAANDRINAMDHGAIIDALARPDQNRGWIEGYLIRQRALQSNSLGAWPAPKR